MTNGEKIETILNVDRDCTEVHGENGTMTFTVTQDWWNAEYKEPATKNDLGVDCISREAVLDKAKSYNTDGYDSYTPLVVDVEDIEDLPSVTPIRPKGHWINIGRINECSCCHESLFPFYDSGYGSIYGSIYHNFCPKCGADMSEVEK